MCDPAVLSAHLPFSDRSHVRERFSCRMMRLESIPLVVNRLERWNRHGRPRSPSARRRQLRCSSIRVPISDMHRIVFTVLLVAN
jgi:hypothetical protein